MPAALNYKVVADSSKGIRASIKDVVRTIIEGAVLAVLIVFTIFRFFPLYSYYRFNLTDYPTWHINIHLGIWV